MKQFILYFLLINTTLNAQETFSQNFWESLIVPSQENVSSIITFPSGKIYCGTGDGVYYSDDNGNTWFSTGFPVIAVFSLLSNSQSDIFASASNNIYKLIYNIDEWEPIIAPFDFGSSLFISYENSILVGKWGGIIKASESDTCWTYVLETSNTEVFYEIAENTSGVLYAGSTNFLGGGGVYQSVDSGNTWQNIGMIDHYVSSLALNSNGDLFAGTQGHQYLFTGGVFVLPNGETEWIKLYNGLVTSLVIDNDDNIYAGLSSLNGNNAGVHVLYNNGQNWEQINTGLSNLAVSKLYISYDNYLYAICLKDYGYPLFRSTKPITNVNENMGIKHEIELYNYPNPFSNKTTIIYNNSVIKSKNSILSIYNVQGILIKQFKMTPFNDNKQTVIFDASGLNAGIYYYSILNKDIQLSKKMILLE